MHASSFTAINDSNNNNIDSNKDDEIDDQQVDVELAPDEDCSDHEENVETNVENTSMTEPDVEDKTENQSSALEKGSEDDLENNSVYSHGSRQSEKDGAESISRESVAQLRTSKLSFGIDRILNQGNSTTPHKSTLVKNGNFPDKTDASSRDIVYNPTPGHQAIVSPGQARLTPSPEGTRSSHAGTRRALSVDMPPDTSSFRAPFLPPDICRVESGSLELLPLRPMWPDVFVCPWTGMQRDRYGLVRRVGHPYQNRTPPKRKKPRTAFTRQQVLELEKRFTRQKYLASAERSALAKSLNMTDAQVKTWFQNRRTKWRRQTAEEREIERQAAHKFLLSLRTDETNRPRNYGPLCSTALPTSDGQPLASP